MSEDDMLSTIEQVYHFGQTPVCLFHKKQHPKKEEFINLNSFDSFFSKNNNPEIDFVNIDKDEKTQGTVLAVFILIKKIITIKNTGYLFFVVEYLQKNIGVGGFTGTEYCLKLFFK